MLYQATPPFILTMTGGTCKRRRRRRREPTQFKHNTTSPSASSPVRDSPNVLPDTDSDHNAFETTPKRCRRKIKLMQEPCLASTPVQAKSPEISKTESASKKSKLYSRRSHKPRQIIKKQKASNKNNGIHSKKRGGKRRKTKYANLNQLSTEQPQCCRPRFNLEKSSAEEQDTLPSSDLSIELSIHEEPPPLLSFEENEDQEEEDEELPSFLMVDSKSSSITTGGFVWHKLRNFPFWPAMVKRVNHKLKRASIMIIDEKLIQQKKGFLVALKTLKPYECEESSDLICKAKEKYDVAIRWSIELIEDYIIRKGNGSFSGSFIEYYTHDMSYPVRRKYLASSESLTIANDVVMEESSPVDELLDDSFSEQQEKHTMTSKRLLPDRTHAAHNRANEKLVHFIVKQRMVDQHLLAVMQGQQPSRWLCSFLSTSQKRVVNIYLEDDKQLDQVYWCLSELYTTAAATDTCLEDIKSKDPVPFVLDVLLPEAIIHAIAGVENISIKKAEEKYLKGRCISKRERQEFDLMIEKWMERKSLPSAFAVFSETFK